MGKRLANLREIVDTSRAFARLGRSPWWYLGFHYRGRLGARWTRACYEEIVSLRYRGKALRFPIDPAYGSTMIGVFVDDEYELEHLGIADCRRILDLGANIGMAAASLNVQFPGASFILVEPDPRNLNKLRQTVQLNSLDATIVQAAVAETAGRLLLRTGENPTCSALETTTLHNNPDKFMVDVLTVPQILDSAGWDTVDLVKIDIEGMEQAIITAEPSWLDRVGAVVLEIHPVCDEAAIGRTLSEHGFQLRRHKPGREPVFIALRQAVPKSSVSKPPP